MQTVGDFRVIHSDVIHLEAGDSISLTFDLPKNVYIDDAQPQSYVLFDYYVSKAQRLIFHMAINDHKIDSFTGLEGTHLNHNMELIDSNWLKPGRNNLNFEIEQGEGKLHIYEAVLNLSLIHI